MRTRNPVAKDYYGILGVSREATDDEIKRAYRKLARRVSPGRQPGPGSAREVQGHQRGVRGAQRRPEAADRRPGRRPAGARRWWRPGWRCRRRRPVRRLPGHHGRVLRDGGRRRHPRPAPAHPARRRRDPASRARPGGDRLRRRGADHRRHRGAVHPVLRGRHRARHPPGHLRDLRWPRRGAERAAHVPRPGRLAPAPARSARATARSSRTHARPAPATAASAPAARSP